MTLKVRHENLLTYRLQFFAQDGPGGEKTEPATAKKLSDARKEGQVAKSNELVNAMSLIALFVILKIFIEKIGTGLITNFTSVYNKISDLDNAQEINTNTVQGLTSDLMLHMLLLMLPVLITGFIVVFVGELIQVRWHPTMKPLTPKFSKINPLKGFKRIFSMQSIVGLLKSIAVITVIYITVYQTLKKDIGVIYSLYDMPLLTAIILIGKLVLDIGLKISLIYLIIGLADFIYQKFKFSQDMKMTKQEIKDEFKNTEGDPQVKGRIKRKMLEVSQRRMMQSLPQADVVITNPTHFAVAIKYDASVSKAPIVLAKGEDFLAQKIKETAKEHGIEIVENKPLARMLYFNVDIDSEIPEELYQSVAEVLAFVYNLKNNRK